MCRVYVPNILPSLVILAVEMDLSVCLFCGVCVHVCMCTPVCT